VIVSNQNVLKAWIPSKKPRGQYGKHVVKHMLYDRFSAQAPTGNTVGVGAEANVIGTSE
jgi:hypothetical protein